MIGRTYMLRSPDPDCPRCKGTGTLRQANVHAEWAVECACVKPHSTVLAMAGKGRTDG